MAHHYHEREETNWFSEYQRQADKNKSLEQDNTALKAEVKGLREALGQVRDGAQYEIDFYNKYGPTWTSRETGHEYQDTSAVITKAEETVDVCNKALATGQKVEQVEVAKTKGVGEW